MRLLSNVGAETPLGVLIRIRSEDDKDVLKCYSKEQLKIREKWRKEHRKEQSQKELDLKYKQISEAFHSML